MEIKTIILSIVFVITLLVLVIIHEIGHFLMAKRFGIKVEEFGFGIPPRAIGKRIGETIYSLNWLPLGGFVRLLGEDSVNKKVLQNPRSFANQNVYKRILVVLAGVVMNLVLAWILFYTVIISQNFTIIYPSEPGVYIAEVKKGFPAEKAGIKEGEKILSIDNQTFNDEKIPETEKATQLIKAKGEIPSSFLIAARDGNNQRIITLTPQKQADGNVLIGVSFSSFPFRQYKSMPEKLSSGITYSGDLTKFTFLGLGKLIQELLLADFKTASQVVSGPIGIGHASVDILSGGVKNLPIYAWFTGVISLTLAIFNVLPIPALDGGRLLFLVIEAVTKKKVKEEIESMVHQIGFVVLIALAILITYSDIRKLLP